MTNLVRNLERLAGLFVAIGVMCALTAFALYTGVPISPRGVASLLLAISGISFATLLGVARWYGNAKREMGNIK